MPTNRSRWEQSHRGARWVEAGPAYRYAYEMQNDPKYRGRSYSEIENDLRNDWKNRGEPTAWDRISTNVREAWNDITSLTAKAAYAHERGHRQLCPFTLWWPQQVY
jgi:hypothetical protein